MSELEERLRQVEQDTAVLRHDVNNMRLAVTGLDTKIDKVQSSIVSLGITIVGSILLMCLGIIAYFIVQKDDQLRELRSIAMQIESSSKQHK